MDFSKVFSFFLHEGFVDNQAIRRFLPAAEDSQPYIQGKSCKLNSKIHGLFSVISFDRLYQYESHRYEGEVDGSQNS
jgi:hypothetical protein